MSYTALYRKFRPQSFDEVKGQDPIVKALRNQISSGRIGHAYLFCGTRGTGKTSVAKIFARAVNCEHPVDGNPCNECPACRSIASGAAMNVSEIDAASNNGVENIRQIREEIQYSPAEGKYKVYIIDEVHMLSIGAFNALLKTLEEPPAYVIFVLATTEAHKIPVTILSRCQRYDFKRISIDTIASRLTELLEREKIDADARAVRYVAKAADGSMRDALSLMDQCVAYYPDQPLKYENVLEVLGAADTEVFSRLMQSIGRDDVAGSLRIVDEIIMQGREPGQFVSDFIWYMRNLLLVKTSDRIDDVIDASRERVDALKKEARMFDEEVLMRYIRICSELSANLRQSAQKRVLIEIAVIKMHRPAMERDVSSLIQRVDSLEKALKEGAFSGNSQDNNKDISGGASAEGSQAGGTGGEETTVANESQADESDGEEMAVAKNPDEAEPDAGRNGAGAAGETGSAGVNESQTGDKSETSAKKEPDAAGANAQSIADRWDEVTRKAPMPLKFSLQRAFPSAPERDTLLLQFDKGSIGYDSFKHHSAGEQLKTLLRNEFNQDLRILVRERGLGAEDDSAFQNVLNRTQFDIDEEDF